jgi:hypothetical protein
MYFRADHPSDAADKITAARQRKVCAKRAAKQQQQQGEEGEAAMPLAETAPTQGTAQNAKRVAKSKRKRSTARPVGGDYGLTDKNASEERAMERAHTGEAIRWAAFLCATTATTAAREDSIGFRRARMPGVQWLGTLLVPHGLHEWLRWQLLGLPPTGRTQKEWGRVREDESKKRAAQYTGGYGETTETGETETVVVQEEEVVPAERDAGQSNRAAAEAQQEQKKCKRHAQKKQNYRRARHSSERTPRVSVRAGVGVSETKREMRVVKVSMGGALREYEVNSGQHSAGAMQDDGYDGADPRGKGLKDTASCSCGWGRGGGERSVVVPG